MRPFKSKRFFENEVVGFFDRFDLLMVLFEWVYYFGFTLVFLKEFTLVLLRGAKVLLILIYIYKKELYLHI